MIDLLDVGSGIGNAGMIDVYFGKEKKNYTRLDINPDTKPDILHDITQPLPEEHRSRYDVVFSSHMLEHMSRADVFPVLRNIISGVKNHGEVWIIVPSMEWCAAQLMQHKDGMVIQGLLYGAQEQGNPWDIHKSGFTLSALRRMMEICGLVIKRAYQAPIVVFMDGKEFPGVQNVCIGARVDELNPPKKEGEEIVIEKEKESLLVTE